MKTKEAYIDELITNIILFLFIFALLAIIFLGVTEMNDRNRVQQSIIDGLRKQNKKESDSLNQVLKVTQDSLEAAFATIRQAYIERQAAHERSQKMIRNYESILYIKYDSDSARINALKKLYPSWK